MNENDVGQFFDSLTADYSKAIERCFPRYREMLWALLNYLPPSRTVNSVLELGCGTGNLSVVLRESFPEANIQLVDISADSLDECRSRFESTDGLKFEQQDFRELTYADGSFDLIVSSIAIHHLPSIEKRTLFAKCHAWLIDDGVFSFADQCAGATEDLYARHMENWKQLSLKAGSTTAEWDMWMQHQADHDFHDTLVDQIDWLRDAGFANVDCTWRYLLWSVVQGRK